MSEEAKELLKRLKKEKKINKQIDLIQKLKEHNQEDIVTNVLLVHLERKDHDAFRIEVLNALNPEDDLVVKPLTQIMLDKNEPQPVRDKAIMLLGANKGKKALGSLLTAYKKIKDVLFLDNIVNALTHFDDDKVVKPLIKALHNDELCLHALTGIARNENLLLGSAPLIKEIVALGVTKNFEKLHYDKIIDNICDEFGYKTVDDILAAIKNKTLSKNTEIYRKRQASIDKTLKKVEPPQL